MLEGFGGILKMTIPYSRQSDDKTISLYAVLFEPDLGAYSVLQMQGSHRNYRPLSTSLEHSKLIVGHARHSMTYGRYSKGERVKLRDAINVLHYYSADVIRRIQMQLNRFSPLHFGSMSPGDTAPLGPYIAFAFTHIIFGPIPAKALWFE